MDKDVKYVPIFSYELALFLTHEGWVVHHTAPNKENHNLKVYYFNFAPGIYEDMNKYRSIKEDKPMGQHITKTFRGEPDYLVPIYDNKMVRSAWNNASAAVQQYGGYLNAVLETQRQIAALEAASANPPSIDTDGKNPPVGKPGDYDTSGGATMDEIKRIVAQMKANSAQHGSEDAAGKLRLNKANLALGEQLAKLIGRVVVRGDDGVWYLDRVGGKRLYSTYPYSTYHTGGVAGDNPTLKQNEIIAKLEKGEVIIPEKQQDNLYEILDTQETMLAKYGALFGAVQSTDLVGSKMQEQIKQDVQQTQSIVKQRDISIENNLTIPVQVLQKLDQSEIKKLTKDISKHTVSEINDVFRKNGMDSVLNPLRPR